MRTRDANDILNSLAPVEAGEQLIIPSRHRDRGRKNHMRGSGLEKQFISWDGEAAGTGKDSPQDYCLIGNSMGGQLVNRDGALHTVDILKFMLSESERLKGSIHVSFGFNYDVNHIIRNLTFKMLRQLHQKNVVYYGTYRLEWIPSKWFSVSHRETERYIRIYDTFGFWGTSLVNAIRQDPELRSHPDLDRIESGKRDRGTFELSELDSKVIPYFQAEMELHVKLMENLRRSLVEVDLVPAEWYGPSAIISAVYKRAKIKQHMNRPVSDLTRERRPKRGRIQKPDKSFEYTLPDDVNRVARAAFAGGRFEQFKIGYYEGPVYGYDITSAYPYAMLSLPSLSGGQWNYVDRDGLAKWRKNRKDILPWGFYHIKYDHLWQAWDPDLPKESPTHFPHPLFRRDEWGRVSYPFQCEGWYPSYSANAVWNGVKPTCGRIVEGWYYEPRSTIKPFHTAKSGVDFARMFLQRQEYKDLGRDDLSYALKITLNSGYGKTAQRSGVELGDNLPSFHQIEWAGHITDHCRIQIWNAAISAWNKGGLIAVETDAVYSTNRLDLSRPGLGGWKEEIYEGICYLQSGIYFTKQNGEWTFHFRGISKDSLTVEQAREHLHDIEDWSADWPPLYGDTHSFNGIGYSRISDTGPNQFYDKWLKWQDTEREIRLGVHGLKRVHDSEFCEACKKGLSPAKTLHDLITPSYHAGVSHPRKDAWIPEDEGVIWEGGDIAKWEVKPELENVI